MEVTIHTVGENHFFTKQAINKEYNDITKGVNSYIVIYLYTNWIRCICICSVTRTKLGKKGCKPSLLCRFFAFQKRKSCRSSCTPLCSACCTHKMHISGVSVGGKVVTASFSSPPLRQCLQLHSVFFSGPLGGEVSPPKF